MSDHAHATFATAFDYYNYFHRRRISASSFSLTTVTLQAPFVHDQTFPLLLNHGPTLGRARNVGYIDTCSRRRSC